MRKVSVYLVVLFCFVYSQTLFAQQFHVVPVQPSPYQQAGQAGPQPSPVPLPQYPQTQSWADKREGPSPLPQTVIPPFPVPGPSPILPPEPEKSPTTRPNQQREVPAPFAEVMSGFEKFVNNTPSESPVVVKQFGYDLFNRPSSAPAAVDQVPVGPDYVLGPGDEIRIAVWGSVEGQWTVTINRDGNVTLPKVGILGVTGLTFSELKDLLNKEFSKYFTGYDMNVSMGSLRTMRVYVVGNVVKPGAYTVSSLATLFNALIESGGPSKIGTMRDVQLKRNGKTIVHFDMYDLLLRGDKTKDARLMPEDVIFVPPVGPLAAIMGNVMNPSIFELKTETRLLDLIHMAGGLTGLAFSGRVQLQRTEERQFRTIFEGDLLELEKNLQKNFSLKDWDLVKIFAVADKTNIVRITGAVVSPGEFGIVPGTTKVRDVISKSGGLVYYASNEAEATRVKVTQSGPHTERFMVDLTKALGDDPEHNVLLEPNDYLFVRTVPGWRLYWTVNILGEVKYPGTYTIKKGENISSLIERAGGYTDKAYVRGAVFTRERVRELQQKSLEEMVRRLERELLAESSIQAGSSVSADEVTARRVALEQRQKLIELLRNQKVLGRMSIRLANLRLLKGSEFDIELEQGDSLFIPPVNKVVNVVGAVLSQGSFTYVEQMNYKDYVEMAGGYAKYADESQVFALKADGSAIKLSKNWIGWNSSQSRWEASGFTGQNKALEPGDAIVVPEKIDRIAWLRELKDWTQILMNTAVVAGVVLQLFD